MQSKKPIEKEDPEDISINKNVDITDLKFVGIENTYTPGKIYTDQTGRFTVTTRKGKKYVFVLYC